MTGSTSQKLALIAAEYFIKVLNVEVHEKTLCHTLEMLSLWCAKFSNEVPQKVIDGLKVNILKLNKIETIYCWLINFNILERF